MSISCCTVYCCIKLYGRVAPTQLVITSSDRISPTHELSERSEFLFATCKKEKTDRLCVCSAELGFSVEKLSWF